MTNLARNKATVVAFYELMFNACRPREAIELYAGDDYIQHNPHVATGKDGFIAYFERMAREWPGKRVEVKRVLAEGDMVAVRITHTTRVRPHTFKSRAGEVKVDREQALNWSAIVQFRLHDGKIVEDVRR